MRVTRSVFAITLLLLAACASSEPRTPDSNATISPDNGRIAARVTELQHSSQELRKQYQQMGETLKWMQGQIAALRLQVAAQSGKPPAGVPHQQAQNKPEPKSEETKPAEEAVMAETKSEETTTTEEAKPMEMAATEPATEAKPAAQASEAKPEAKPEQAMPAEEKQAVAAKPAEPKPVENKPAEAPAVSGLTDQDMSVEPPAVTAEAKPAAEAKPVTGEVYVVHIASYLEASQVKPGWEQLKARYGAALEGATPFTTSFMDSKDRKWLRLVAGPYNTKPTADKHCNAIKDIGEWCEVLKIDGSSAAPLN